MEIPQADNGVVLRVDYVDHAVWESVRDAALTPMEADYDSFLVAHEEPELDGVDFAAMTAQPDYYEPRVLIAFDRMTREHPEHPLLVVDWLAHVVDEDAAEYEYVPGSMRALPDQVQAIAVNLSLANMDFDDFAGSAGPDGIFRGFPD